MLRNIIPVSILLSLIGCGGSSEETQSEIFSVDEQSISSTVSFYVSPWQSKSGTLKTLDQQGNTLTEQEVEDINTTVLSVDSLSYHYFEFTPTDAELVCPSFNGCGRAASDDENDLNDNRVIDYQEPLSQAITIDYKVALFAAPGVNKTYFSALSSYMVEHNFTPTVSSLAITPFYHLTHSELNSGLEAEILANALNYGAILAMAEDQNFNIETAIQTNEQSSVSLSTYAQFSHQYITENLLSEQGNALIQSVVGQVRQKITNLTSTSKFSTDETTQLLESRELLEDVRNVLGVARLQEQKYNDELQTNLEELQSNFDEEGQATIQSLVQVLTQVLQEYSPITNAQAGIYKLDDLDINYSTGPFRWVITGTHEGSSVQIDLQLPSWRISGVLGDRIEGTMSATVINKEVTLSVDAQDIYIQTQGNSDSFATEEEPTTGIASITTNITLLKGNGTLSGLLSASLTRITTPLDEVLNVISSLDFKGEFLSDNQQTQFNILASEATPFIDEDNGNLVFSLFLDMPLNGANDFEFAYVGDLSALNSLQSGEVYIRVKGRPLDLNVKQVGNNLNAIIKGSHGRWLDVKQKGSNYSGGLYFGDTKIANVTNVRGIPGISFPDGTFESLF